MKVILHLPRNMQSLNLCIVIDCFPIITAEQEEKRMKRSFLMLGISILTLVILTCTGCGSQPAEDTSPPAPERETSSGTNSGLSEPDATALAATGYQLYLHVSGGGDTGSEPAPRQTIDGMDYRQLGGDIDTKAKLEAYLGQAFTGESIYYYM